MSLNHPDSWVTAVSATALTAVGAFMGGLWGWLSNRERLKASPPAEETQAEAALKQVLSEGAAQLLSDYRQELKDARAEIADLRRQVGELVEEGAQCRRDYEALTKAYDSLWEHVETLSRALMNSTISEAVRKDLEGTFVTIEAGRATVTRPALRKAAGA